MFRMLAHASLAMQTAFSCLLVCLLEFYYRRVASEAWLRWFACSWVAQAAYVASLWIAFDDMSGGMAIRVAVALLGFIVPPTIALTSIALLRGRTPARTWIAALYLVGLAAAAITFVAGLPYPLDSVEASRIHNIPRHVCYGLASLLAAVAFARYGRRRHLTGSLVTAGAWAFFGLVNLARAWQWSVTSTWAPRGAENNPDLVQFALITFVTNSVVWIVMSIGVGLLLTETAERSERRAREALRELQEAQTERGRLAQLVEQSRDAILVVSAGQLRYLNGAAAGLLGYAADQIPSLFMKPLDEVCGIAAEDPMRTQMDGSVSAAGVWEGQSEWRNRLTDERIPVLVGAFAMGTREGDAASTGLIGRDLRERVRLEEELRQAQRQEALGRLAGGIAHDFNNLLTVMMGYASLAIEEGLSEGLRQNIGEILSAARRAAAITGRLRAFGRRQALRAAAFDLNALVDSMRGTLDKLVEGDVELSYDLCETSLPVRADAAQIEQVLMNLVVNARQAIDGRGRIVVRTADFKEGDRSGTLDAALEWRDPNGKVLLVESRNMVFYSDPKLRIIDFEISLTAAEDVTFGDTKEGAFAIRLAETLTEKKGGKMADADGRAAMAQVWGKRSNWVDCSGEVEGEKLGVAIFDSPQNPRHPTYWHARDYGLFALNPFGAHAFDPAQPESHWQLAKGKQLVFRWRVVIHPGDSESGHVGDLYKDYIGQAR